MQLGKLYLSPERLDVFNLDSAKLELTLALELNSIITGSLMLLGHIALIEGDFIKADEFFSAVIGSDIKNVEGYYFLGYLAWKGGDIQESKILLDNAITNKQQEKSKGKELSEGDTKDVVSYLRLINVSLFYPFVEKFDQIESEEGKGNEYLIQQYRKLDSFLLHLGEVNHMNY